jgi:hypothetical protein
MKVHNHLDFFLDRQFMLCSQSRRILQWSSIGMPTALAQLTGTMSVAHSRCPLARRLSTSSQVFWRLCAHGRPAVRGKQRSAVGPRLRAVFSGANARVKGSRASSDRLRRTSPFSGRSTRRWGCEGMLGLRRFLTHPRRHTFRPCTVLYRSYRTTSNTPPPITRQGRARPPGRTR